MAACTVQGRHGLREAVDRPLIVTLGPVGSAKKEVRQGLGHHVSTGRREGEGALRGGDGLAIRAMLRKWTERKPEICPSRR